MDILVLELLLEDGHEVIGDFVVTFTKKPTKFSTFGFGRTRSKIICFNRLT